MSTYMALTHIQVGNMTATGDHSQSCYSHIPASGIRHCPSWMSLVASCLHALRPYQSCRDHLPASTAHGKRRGHRSKKPVTLATRVHFRTPNKLANRGLLQGRLRTRPVLRCVMLLRNGSTLVQVNELSQTLTDAEAAHDAHAREDARG